MTQATGARDVTRLEPLVCFLFYSTNDYTTTPTNDNEDQDNLNDNEDSDDSRYQQQGPNDALRVVWAICASFFSFVLFFDF